MLDEKTWMWKVTVKPQAERLPLKINHGGLYMDLGIGGLYQGQTYRRTYSAENNWDSYSGTTRTVQKAAAAQQKMKKLQYSFKTISAQIMTSKTSTVARQVAGHR